MPCWTRGSERGGMGAEVLLKLHHLHLELPNGTALLEDVSLNVRRGDALGVV